MIGRSFFRVLFGAGLALGLIGLTPIPVHAGSSAWFPDALDDTMFGANSPTQDIVGLRVVETPDTTTFTAVFGADPDPLSWAGLQDSRWQRRWLTFTFHGGAATVESDGTRLTARGACPASVATDSARASVSITLARSCASGVDWPGEYTATLSKSSGSTSGPVDSVSSPSQAGSYLMVTGAGDVHSFAAHNYSGTLPTRSSAVVDVEASRFGGYLLLDSNGVVTAKNHLSHRGNATLRPAETAVSISLTPSYAGYWVFTDKGRVIPFGDAKHFGDMAGIALNGPVLDSIATPTGKGYYMVASDGGVFAFGDAKFHGSMGAVRLNAPVQSLVPDPDGTGYWLVASDGGVFAFDATFRGSMGATRLNKPVTGMVPNGNGYLMVGEDGGIFNFSDQPFHGSLGNNPPASPVVAVAAVRP